MNDRFLRLTRAEQLQSMVGKECTPSQNAYVRRFFGALTVTIAEEEIRLPKGRGLLTMQQRQTVEEIKSRGQKARSRGHKQSGAMSWDEHRPKGSGGALNV